jgi:uncharacterized membrane protein HdeD (DUF308 family)
MSERTATMVILDEREAAREAAGLWWLFLLTGLAWMIVAWLVLRWSPTSITTIAYLFGFVAIFFGINEFMVMGGSTTGWKIFHGLFGVIAIVAGIIAFFNPSSTFFALASIIAFLFILKGTMDIVVSIATRSEIEVWWLQLVVGIIELMLGFWAAGPGFEQYGRKALLLVLWVGLTCLFRGITEIVFAFKLRGVNKELHRPVTA